MRRPDLPSITHRLLRRRAAALFWLYPFVAVCSLACGAATALDGDPPSKDQDAPTPQIESGKNDEPIPKPGGDQPKPQTPGADDEDAINLPSFELPDCHRGAKPNTVAECPYLADGLCYDDVASACACVCPRGPDTFCFEGLFLNVWNGVDVWCSEA